MIRPATGVGSRREGRGARSAGALGRKMIETRDHRQLIRDLLPKYGLDPEIIEIVENVAARSTELGYPDSNPLRAARSIRRSNGESFILLASQITDDMIESIKSALLARGFEDEVQRLTTEDLFLKHVVLHEIAAFVLGTAEQE